MDNLDELFSGFNGSATQKNAIKIEQDKKEEKNESIEKIEKKIKLNDQNHIKSEETQVNKQVIQNAKQQDMIPEQIDNKLQFQKEKHQLNQFEIFHESEDYENCRHEVFYPKSYLRKSLPKEKKEYKIYKFKLDPFQKKAVQCIKCEESVLVAAHTSAGKTAVAEYAIAMSLQLNQKVIYTSPIKALSNQKYREFSEEFKDVGLVTGDVTLNQNAKCLVMTTEILRSMLYKGTEITREVSWVIFDEVHYMRDKERGVVWEETMILLNQNVNYVFLSATIPNAPEFAEWICKIKNKPCNVIYTEQRPVPLQHFIYPSGGQGLFLVVDEKGRFKEDNFQKSLSVLGDSVDMGDNDQKKRKKPTEGSELNKIIKLIIEKNYDPCIIFSFSKKEVEGYALAMVSRDFTTPDTKEKIEDIFKRAISCLSEEDQKLPQITQMLPVLKKGIGIHHGGLLPLIKEVVEILFQEGLLKILFSTETFSLGLNMPARTVVFTSVRKFDGEEIRLLQGGEYIQMSGRAGRRGLDDLGFTILMVDERMDIDSAKSMLKGHADPLYSSFHLNNNMLINSMRIEDTDPEYIIRRSFLQYKNDKAIPEMVQKLEEIKKQRDEIVIENEQQVSEIYKLDLQIQKYREEVRKIANQPQYLCQFLCIGRLIHIVNKGKDFGWGISINFFQKRNNLKRNRNNEQMENVFIDVMLFIKKRQKLQQQPEPASLDEEGDLEVVQVLNETVVEISSIKIGLPKNLIQDESKQQIKETLIEISKQFGKKVPILHPIKDMKINDENLDKMLKKLEKAETMKGQLCQNNEIQVEQQLNKYKEKQKFVQTITYLKQQIDNSQSMVLNDDLQCMKRVLRRLDFIKRDGLEDIVQIKGKVACEISACDEVLATQLLFNGLFNEMEPAMITAVLSALIHDENTANEKQQIKNAEINKYFQLVLEEAKKIYQIMQESKINIEEKQYLGSLKPQLVDIVYNWCKGATFKEICAQCDVYEGQIIRGMRRLDELLKQMENAAKVIGNLELAQKFVDASKLLKRGIVFAASLYL